MLINSIKIILGKGNPSTALIFLKFIMKFCHFTFDIKFSIAILDESIE
jgi:hypothetical protein